MTRPWRVGEARITTLGPGGKTQDEAPPANGSLAGRRLLSRAGALALLVSLMFLPLTQPVATPLSAIDPGLMFGQTPDSTGFEFWAINPPNINFGPDPFGIGIINPSPVAANVNVYGYSTTIGDHIIVASATVPALGSHVFSLTAGTALDATAITNQSTFFVQSDVEIGAIQLAPLDSVESNDASLLLPQHSLATEYRIMSFNPDARQSFFTVVATAPDTEVIVTTASAALPDAGLGTIPGSVPQRVVLQPFEVLHIRPDDSVDLTGSTVSASEPVAVFAGTVCTRVGGAGACDHTSEQVWPLHSWGRTYVACRAPQRSTEDVTHRIMALQEGVTEVRVQPTGETRSLAQGAYVDLEHAGDVVIEADQAIAVGEFLHGDPSSAHLGDPSFTQVAPVDHWGYGTRFLVPPDFPEMHVVASAHVEVDAEWETGTPIAPWSTIPGTDYKCSRDTTTVGPHELTSILPAAPAWSPTGLTPPKPCPRAGIEEPEDPDKTPQPSPSEGQEPTPSPSVSPPPPPEGGETEVCEPDFPTANRTKAPRFGVRVYGYDTYGSFGYPAGLHDPTPLPAPVTWGAGDLFAGELLVTGNDPGCGLGAIDSFSPARPDQAQFLPLPSETASNPVPPNLMGPRFLHGGSSISWPGGETFFAVGGTDDCMDFLPRSDTEFIYNSHTSGLLPFQAGPSLNVPRIEPATAADYARSRLFVAGGDSTGGDPRSPDSWHRPTAVFEELDPASGAWVIREPMPAGVVGAAAMYDPVNNDIVVAGGASHPQTVNRATQVYDIDSQDWLGEHVQKPLRGLSAVNCNGWPFIYGKAGSDVGPEHMYEWSFMPQSEAPLAQRGLGDGFPVSAPLYPMTMLYSAMTVHDKYIVASGGIQKFWSGTPVPTTAVVYYDCTSDTNPWSFMTSMPAARAEHGMEATSAVLYVFGGATGATSSTWTGRWEGACPTDSVISMPMFGSTWTAKANLPLKLASMGTAQLPNGWIALVGGRTNGTDQDGDPSCHIASDRVLFYNPTTNAYIDGPSLPEGLIAPSVEVVGNSLYVVGGDETGDEPVPLQSTDARQRRPSTDVYVLRFHPLLEDLAVAPFWESLDELPLGVVHGAMVLGRDGNLYVVGGNHHPEVAVRMAQELNTEPLTCILEFVGGSGPCYVPVVDDELELRREDWPGAHLNSARAHHVLEFDVKTGNWIAYGGLSQGSLYHTEPDLTQWADSLEIHAMGFGDFIEAPDPAPHAFPIGQSSHRPSAATGTTMAMHRTLDVVPLG